MYNTTNTAVIILLTSFCYANLQLEMWFLI